MAVHHHKLPIVTDGLAFQVDAANDLCDNVTNVRNIVTPTQTGSFINQASVVNDAYDFDGVDDYIDFGNSTAWDSASSTIEVWIYPETGTRTIYQRDDASDSNKYLQFQISGTGNEFIIASRNGGTLNRNWFSVTSPTFNAWNCLTITKVPDTTALNKYGVKMYVNGVEDTGVYVNSDLTGDGVDQWSNLMTGLDATYMGIFNQAGVLQNYWKGQISNLKIYNKALTATEITQNYEATKHKFE